ncbi:hypothetical protein [Flavobacterium ginsengisoli]|uniref:hypothetical protein n=1 Tax=Flavobacterium ginsengisoli TaxID=871694 RepID=UPI0030F6227B
MLAMYDAFFKAGLNPTKKYANGANLLLLAIASDKDLKVADYFSTKGMSLKDVDNDGNTAFTYARKIWKYCSFEKTCRKRH